MKTTILVAVMTCITSATLAQSIERHVVSFAGNENFTLGESIITQHTTDKNHIHFGFQQGHIKTVGISQGGKLNFAKAFPNPVSDYVSVTGFEHTSEEVAFRIINLSGSIVLEGEISKHQSSINLSELPNGIYTLLLLAADGSQYNTKLTKTP